MINKQGQKVGPKEEVASASLTNHALLAAGC